MQRQTNTKEKIKDVFIKLINEKGFDSISVSDITRNANINRGTFYLHYLDKYDLLEKLEDELINEITNILIDETSIYDLENNSPFEYDVVLKMLNYAKTEFSFIAAIASEKGDPQFPSKFKKLLHLQITTKFGDLTKKLTPLVDGLSVDYNIEIMLAAPAAIILLWINNGGKDSSEKIAKLIVDGTRISPYDIVY